MESHDIFSSVLRPLYGVDDTQYSIQRVLNNINALFCVSSSSLSLRISNTKKPVDLICHTGVDSFFSDFYLKKRSYHDPISERVTRYELDSGFTMADLCNQDPEWGKVHRSSFQSFGYKDALLVNFYSQNGDRGILAVRSDPRRGEFKVADSDTISQLSPLLRTALNVHLQLCNQSLNETDVPDAFSNSATAIINISKSGRLIKMNSEGHGVLVREDGILLHNNHIKMQDSHSHFQFKKSLVDIFTTTHQHTKLIKVQRERDRFYLVRIVANNSILLNDHNATLIICDPFHNVRSESILCTLFNLTLREANVATHLGNGSKLSDIATQNGVSINTVKSQRNIIYEKIGIRNQIQLVRIVCYLEIIVETEIQTLHENKWISSSLHNSIFQKLSIDE